MAMKRRMALPWRVAWGVGAILVLALAGLPAALAQSNLPPAVQTDLLRDQIYGEAKANDPEAVLRSLDQYKKLDGVVVLPPPLLWIEAKAAHDAGDGKRALDALGSFLASSPRGSAQYNEALASYPTYQQAAGAADALQIDARRAASQASIPTVLSEIESTIVTVPGGRLSIGSTGAMAGALHVKTPGGRGR